MTNKSLEIQKITISAINNIQQFKNNNIIAYASVPLKIKLPYIKLASLKSSSILGASNISRFNVDFFIATNGKNNTTILNIMEVMYRELPNAIFNEIDTNKNNISVSVQNIIDMNFSITEDIKNGTWYGYFTVILDVI